jgi:hypothetical protein
VSDELSERIEPLLPRGEGALPRWPQTAARPTGLADILFVLHTGGAAQSGPSPAGLQAPRDHRRWRYPTAASLTGANRGSTFLAGVSIQQAGGVLFSREDRIGRPFPSQPTSLSSSPSTRSSIQLSSRCTTSSLSA